MDRSFLLFNKSSEDMSEVTSASVDMVFAAPPYNIGTHYGQNVDSLLLPKFQRMLKAVFAESYRILKPDGKLVIECADSIFSNGVYIQLAGYVQSLCVTLGFNVQARHINFARSENGVELPEEHWDENYTTTSNAHSNCHQIIVLSKTESSKFETDSKIMYFDYVPVEGHPCPSPEGEYKFILDTYFSTGMTVLDPFMGTGVIGAEVIKRGGYFMGYEKDASIFELAQNNLRGVRV